MNKPALFLIIGVILLSTLFPFHLTISMVSTHQAINSTIINILVIISLSFFALVIKSLEKKLK